MNTKIKMFLSMLVLVSVQLACGLFGTNDVCQYAIVPEGNKVSINNLDGLEWRDCDTQERVK